VHVPYLVKGGEERYVASLTASYEAAGARVSYWPIPDKSASSEALQALTWGDVSNWNDTLAKLKPDRIHLNNIHPALGPAFLRWLQGISIPVIATIHNHRFYCTNGLALYQGHICKACKTKRLPWRPLVFNCNQSWAKSYYHGLSLARIQTEGLLAGLHMLVAPSGYIAAELESAGYAREKIRVVPHPVSVDTSRPDITVKKYDCIYAGRFSEEKGVRRLLKVAEALPNTIFAFAGHGALENEIASAASSRANVVLLKNLDRTALIAAISASKAAFVPSICEESFSLFGVESLLLGVPTVVSPNESLRWLTRLPFPAIPAKGNDVADMIHALEQAWIKASDQFAISMMKEYFSIRKHGLTLLDI